ncbi:MAG TPA: adenylate/guanylate cyclase domain-containing protein [Thermoleophilaceae bacterium]|jgi:class 3 adenylate cyclase
MILGLARWAYRKLGSRYFAAYFAWEVVSALVISAATIAIFGLYQDMSTVEFDRIVVVTWGCVAIGYLAGYRKMRPAFGPLFDWLDGARSERGAAEAWRTAVALPREFVTREVWQPIVFVALPAPAYMTFELDLPWYSFPILVAGALVAVAYSAVLHFFATEIAMRPALEEISGHLPAGFSGAGTGVPLRWKLLGALPVINVITGVVVSGLASADDQVRLQDLGIDVLVALVVAFTLSFELTLLLTRSVVGPVRELVDVTERVRDGDLSARAPVVSGDELGSLASSFNAMMAGLEERQRLHEAFGSYVAPDVARRVLEEGTLLEGEEVEVSIAFVDVRDFTAFAENASARETVAYLNDFFGVAVPILTRHGGHANKFIGDGILAVFGAPQRLSDHADRAVHAACEVARATDERYGDDLRIGIGINSGPVSAGSVGGGGRLDFTVIGDPVNVAARVERMTRETGDRVLMTEATRCLLTDGSIEVEARGALPLKGKSEPVTLYAPHLEAPEPLPAPEPARAADAASLG